MRVLGVGIGVTILVVIWVAVAVAVVACWRRRIVAAAGITITAFIVSALLLLLPQHQAPLQPVEINSVIDHLFIPRVIILLICGASAVVGFGAVIAHWTEPVQARALKKIKT